MKNLSEFTVHKNSTIRDALENINTNAKGIVLVVDSENRLLGTITDGDIRRAILDGKSIDNSIEDVYNKHCKYAVESKVTDAIINQFRNEKIKFIPVVNENMLIVDYIEIGEKDESYKTNRANPVLIMAGGMGTRLKPLTDDIPKPMLKVGDRPILETIINQLRMHGFTNILISVNYKSEIIENYFGDGSGFGVSIKYIREEKRMGTAGAVKLAEEYLHMPFFVVNGDILTKVNYESLLQYHLTNEYTMTIGCRNYETQIPYGVLNIDEALVTSLEEKPVVSYFVSGGIYVLDPKALKYIPGNEYFDITELINSLIKDEERIGSFPIQEYWMDIGHIKDYYKANEDIKKYF